MSTLFSIYFLITNDTIYIVKINNSLFMNIVKCSTFHNNHVCSNLIILYYQLNKLNYFFRYKITKDQRNRQYLFDLKVSACYEAMGCDQSFVIFNQTTFSMNDCQYEKDYLNTSKHIL